MKPGLSNAEQRNPSPEEDAFPQTAKPSWQVGSSLKRRQIEWEPIASCVESVGHEPLVRLPCMIFCMVHERVVHARLIPKILFAQGPPTIRGSFARGSWTEDPWCNNSCDWKGCPRKAVGKTSRAEAQAKTRGRRHGVCDCSFG